MEKDIAQVLISQQQLQERIEALAREVMAEYGDKKPVFVGVLKGVVVFYTDFIRAFRAPCQMDFMWVSSYSGTQSTGKMLVRQDVTEDLKGRHVVILEDIFDTGNSLNFVYQHLLTKEPASIKICTLLDKPARRAPHVTLKADFVGFEVPDLFVVGYGLDYNEYYRNLPYVGVLKPEVYQ